MILTKKAIPIVAFLVITIGGATWLNHLFFRSEDKTALLPGATTHGHYQIELECGACHTNEKKENVFTSSGVDNKSCNACHGEDLEKYSDSHPVRKFRNPENAVFLEHVDASSCISCHTEHNQKVTGEMGLTLPADYCAHCHQVTLENLESHKNLKYDSCATAGCHNYHDNMALSPGFLTKHYGEADILPEPRTKAVNTLARWLAEGNKPRAPLTLADADAPPEHAAESSHVNDWIDSAHSKAGINCSDCHEGLNGTEWIAKPDQNSCNSCHGFQVEGFLKGKHGMRLASSSLSPMTPADARQDMKKEAHHKMLDCSACHQEHRYDREFAAHQACIQCHDDEHSRNYSQSAHSKLWLAELDGSGASGSGVSCATCHLPAHRLGDHHAINHNQNNNLTPNEKMLRSVCLNCHGLQFSMDSLASENLIRNNFSQSPDQKHPGISWALKAAVQNGNQEIIDLKEWLEANPGRAKHDFEAQEDNSR